MQQFILTREQHLGDTLRLKLFVFRDTSDVEVGEKSNGGHFVTLIEIRVHLIAFWTQSEFQSSVVKPKPK